MVCSKCKKREAVVFLTIVEENGEKTELNLCEMCAKESVLNSYMFDNFISALFNIESEQNEEKSASISSVLKCSKCGLTYDNLMKYGKAGCDKCYENFSSVIMPIVKRIHGKEQHMGKVIKSKQFDMIKKQEISRLQAKLDEAVQSENYEKAAEYRDMIKTYTQ
ncbi:MAG: UvrB/UvrC motif-containing protein [Eubacteriaceae bacterium]